MRYKAILFCLWYGLLPWWCYERTCHYAGESYGAHLLRNLCCAWRWLRGRQWLGDIRFEIEVNHYRRAPKAKRGSISKYFTGP